MFGMGQRKQEEKVPDGQGVGPTYAAPDPHRSGPYTAAGGGWAPGHQPVEDQWAQHNHYDSPPPGAPETWGKYHSHVVESYGEEISATTPTESSVNEQSRASDPRWNPATPGRIQRSPSTWRFFRLFDQIGARHLNGNHQSMADHERTYEIGGMQPARERSRRNTYRLEPAPWDEHIVDKVADDAQVNATYVVPDSPQTGGRSWRL